MSGIRGQLRSTVLFGEKVVLTDDLQGVAVGAVALSTPGDDLIAGGILPDAISGGDGNDTLIGGGSNDTLHSDAANDSLRGDRGRDRLFGDAGDDTLGGGIGDDRIEGGDGMDVATFAADRSDYKIVTTTDGLVVTDLAPFRQGNEGTDQLQDVETVQFADRSFSPVSLIETSEIDGKNGVFIQGADLEDFTGWTVESAGDLNGDGFDDLVLTAPGAGEEYGPGETYVVFGKAAGWSESFSVASLDGTNGFVIDGAGSSLAFGDVNGDGFSDLILGGGHFSGYYTTGTTVVFGKAAGWTASLDPAVVDGTDGFRVAGVSVLSTSVGSAGDVNGDGLDDIIIGDPYAATSYLVFGRAEGWPATLDLASLDGTDGLRLDGAGRAVAVIGDVNGDGFDDVGIMKLSDSGVNGYVVFGHGGGWPSALDLTSLSPSDGFSITGAYSLFDVAAAGDVNGDGIDDLVVSGFQGAYNTGIGDAHVVFGTTSGFSASLDLSTLDGTDGFRVEGVDSWINGEATGISVAGAGDVNGDGFDDVIIDSPYEFGGGHAYVIYGKASGFAPVADVVSLTADGHSGFAIFEDNFFTEGFGYSVSTARDVNGDGFADMFISGPAGGDLGGTTSSGRGVLVFGGELDGFRTFVGTGGRDLRIGSAEAESFIGAQASDTLIGGGGADVFHGGQGNDGIVVSDTAFVRVDGGTGTDTLRLAGHDLSLDLTTMPDARIRGIEQIDLRGGGDSSLRLSVHDVLDLSDTSNQLLVKGTAGDSADIGAGWTAAGTTCVAGQTYQVFTAGEATLLVDADVAVTAVATA